MQEKAANRKLCTQEDYVNRKIVRAELQANLVY